jgi:hypothetical protein
MLRHVVAVIFLTGMLVALTTVAPVHSAESMALLATPTANASVPGPAPDHELCTDTEIAKGETDIVVEPPETGGVVVPVAAPDLNLWVVQITVAPQSCRAFQAPTFNTERGALVLFVQSGTIDYGAYSATTPPVTVRMGHQEDESTFAEVPQDQFVTLHSGDWVSQDRATWFTYRNPGPGSAVISMAGLVAQSDEECGGGCKKG